MSLQFMHAATMPLSLQSPMHVMLSNRGRGKFVAPDGSHLCSPITRLLLPAQTPDEVQCVMNAAMYAYLINQPDMDLEPVKQELNGPTCKRARC